MKIVYDLPPNWLRLCEAFPEAKQHRPFVSYAGTIYATHKVTPDVYDHECIHDEQQSAIGLEAWWERYYSDPVFRYSQELPAYRQQIKTYSKTNRDKNAIARYRNAVAHILSGELYGNCATYQEALKDLLC